MLSHSRRELKWREIVDGYGEYLERVCALGTGTRDRYTKWAMELLEMHSSSQAFDPAHLSHAILTAYIKSKAKRYKPKTIRSLASGVRSFLRYLQFTGLAGPELIRAVPPLPVWRQPNIPKGLEDDQLATLMGSFDQSRPVGQRNYAIVACLAGLGLRAGEVAALYNTGARVSELINLRVRDIRLDCEASIHLHGKGRKQRAVPLWKNTVVALRQWLRRLDGGLETPTFPNREGLPLSRSGVVYRLRLAVQQAAKQHPPLRGRRISPHTLRHTTAMHMLQSGVDITVIALWLGHESPVTTHHYIEADLKMKERALAKIQDPPFRRSRYRPPDRLLAFLEGL